ncbi:50S ribosomal protein L4 [candidate division WWE3 bacterium CG10_big_fil_rev_8_21_14_0_10_32_10]|uniref:Large ribosomal subunit protein uL4 n=1 Tax=candidate division WWE3 bacterium CG10_big_fil_rev_8_21_14_0_10_32_10 TaxID=1975090 RepID=A0A2H0RAX6_UNCKA|nr:MAG: 50S ribosomal protein L4 [candidate division WWE3 bacterium CG10_big_fil_rev_8_21_14_0_10_32_10]
MKIPFYTKKLEKQTKEISDKILVVEGKKEALLQTLRVYFFNKRQGSVKTKTRGEVSGGGRKPWRQKGTGRARHGSIRSPLWSGGGVSHGPRPKNWNLNINKKMKRIAFNYVLTEKLKNNKVLVIDFPGMTEPKTKEVKKLLKDVYNKVLPKSMLIITSKGEVILNKSLANLTNVFVRNVSTVNAFDILKSDSVIITSDSFVYLEERLKVK